MSNVCPTPDCVELWDSPEVKLAGDLPTAVFFFFSRYVSLTHFPACFSRVLLHVAHLPGSFLHTFRKVSGQNGNPVIPFLR